MLLRTTTIWSAASGGLSTKIVDEENDKEFEDFLDHAFAVMERGAVVILNKFIPEGKRYEATQRCGTDPDDVRRDAGHSGPIQG